MGFDFHFLNINPFAKKGVANENSNYTNDTHSGSSGSFETEDVSLMANNQATNETTFGTNEEIASELTQIANILTEQEEQATATTRTTRTTRTAPAATTTTTAATTNTQKPYSSTVILTGSTVEATTPTPWGKNFIELKQKDDYTLNDLIEAVYPDASENERKDLKARFLNENADALADINMEGNIKESLNDKLSNLRYPKFNSLNYNKTSDDLTQEVKFNADENYTFNSGNYKSDPRSAISQDILDHYGIKDGDFSSAAGQAIMKAIIENPENAQLFSSSGVKDFSTLDGFLGALTESYMKNGELNLTTPDVAISFLNNGDKEYSTEELRALATQNSNYTSSQLSPTEKSKNFTNDNTYLDILDCIEYSTDSEGNSITLKQAIENASDTEKASMIALGESALLQLAQNNDSLKGLIGEDGQLIKNEDGTSILNNQVGVDNLAVELKPVNYMLRQGAAPQMIETPTPETKPADPDTTTPTEPDPSTPTEPDPSTPTEPEPSTPTETPTVPDTTTPPETPTDPATTTPPETTTCPPVPDVEQPNEDTPTSTPPCSEVPDTSVEDNDKTPEQKTEGAEKNTDNTCGDVPTTNQDNPDGATQLPSQSAGKNSTPQNTAGESDSPTDTSNPSGDSGDNPPGGGDNPPGGGGGGSPQDSGNNNPPGGGGNPSDDNKPNEEQ